ncbi:hypothetical protein KW805_00250 [Candidatus Pacearchaeota archaeon]|nr:hypothetical protein [Candidatus Pacearchaeota archaeon]
MDARRRLYVTFAVLVILVAGLYLFTDWFSKVTGYLSGEDESLKLAQCLKNKGSEFYTSATCADCEKQERVFGNAFGEISFIDCTDMNQCKNIRSVPAWYINNSVVYGFKTLDQLRVLSGCDKK